MSSLYDDIEERQLPQASLLAYQALVEKWARQAEEARVARAQARLLQPQAPRQHGPRKGHCYGLPKKYPVMWMARPLTNSAWFEFKTMQNRPTNDK